jgi:uncharacterized protein (TIGR02266 family)
MADERRTSRRVRISGVRVTYESATGERVDAFALDLGTGGIFVRTAAPLAVGKRISLEIQVVGEAGPWAALGRVVWSREKGQAGAPPGMGVKLIDADDAVLAAIGRLVETREHTEPGVGQGSTPPPAPAPTVPPERERTLLGVGTSPDEARKTPTTPIVPMVPATPATPVPPAAAPPAAPRVAPAAAERPLPKPAPSPLPVAPKAEEKSGGAGRTVVIVVLLVVAGIAAYVFLDALRHHRHSLSGSPSRSAWATA